MLGSFLPSLTPSLRIALPFIQSGVERGLSANGIISALRGAGMGARRSSVLGVVRALQGIKEQTGYLKYVRRDLSPDVSKLPNALTPIRKQYAYTVRLQGVDLAGNTAESFVTVSTDNPALTRGEIEAEAQSYGLSSDRSGGYGNVTATLFGGVKAGTPGVL